MRFAKHTSILAATKTPQSGSQNQRVTLGAHLQPLGSTGALSLGKLSPVINCTEVDLKVTVRSCTRSTQTQGELSMQPQGGAGAAEPGPGNLDLILSPSLPPRAR